MYCAVPYQPICTTNGFSNFFEENFFDAQEYSTSRVHIFLLLLGVYWLACCCSLLAKLRAGKTSGQALHHRNLLEKCW